tara:strand:- start:425 stop:616 length:192 start_codon:yes stop_codon:yes gene_type:complete
MKVKITTDKPTHWRGGDDPMVTDTVIKPASSEEDLRQLNTVIITALGRMKYHDVEKIVIEKIK